MTQGEFHGVIVNFDEEETMRSALYYRALRLIEAGFVVDAHIMILATWNFARFRYVTTTFDLVAYENTIKGIATALTSFGADEFMDVDLSKNKDLIVTAFDELSKFRGVEFTGASKMLHLLNPRVFVMWDSAIMGWNGTVPQYEALDIIKSGFWKRRKFAKSGLGYHEFLTLCQDKFSGLYSPETRKTLAKCVDEFNYCKFTVPLQGADGEDARA
jgi:hypothetical protein